jgi:hypothetical protein
VIPVSVVPNQHEDSKIGQIGTDLFNMFLAVGIVTTIIFILIVICEFFIIISSVPKKSTSPKFRKKLA